MQMWMDLGLPQSSAEESLVISIQGLNKTEDKFYIQHAMHQISQQKQLSENE